MAIKASATITLSSIRDIQSVTWYYLLQSSTSQAPAKPTASPPGGSWTDTEPGYTAGSTNSLYTVERTVFTDGTFAYSNVCLDSSYEAAKQAYNKAQTAQSAAQTAQDTIDNLQIGGRNLATETATPRTTQKDGTNNWSTPSGLFPTSYYGLSLLRQTDDSGNFVNNSFTVSFDWEATNVAQAAPNATVAFRRSASSNLQISKKFSIPAGNSHGHYSCTFTPHDDQRAFGQNWLIPSGLGTHTDTAMRFTISNFKFELGDRETDWTPAPEDVQADIDKALSSTEVIVGTQTAATNVWTGVASFPSLTDGQSILYWLPFAGTSTAATLNLTLPDGSTTGAKNVYIDATTRCTTHVSAGNMIQMVYRSGVTIGSSSYTGWWVCRARNDNTYDRIRYNVSVTANAAIASGRLGVFNSSGKLILLSTAAFDVTKPILYVGTAYTATALTQTNNYVSYGASFSLANTVSGFTGTSGAAVYIKGTLSGTMFTPDSGVFTTTKPTTADGKVYMLLGMMVSTTNAILAPEHPMFRYYSGSFQSISQLAYQASVDADTANALMDSDVLKVTSSSVKMADPSTGIYWKIQSGAAGFYDGQNRMFAGIGADDSGGYLAANRLKSPDASVDAHIDATFEHDNVQLTFTVPKYSGSSAEPSGTTPSMNIGSFTGSDYDGTEYSNNMHNYIGAIGSFELQCYDKLGSSGLDEHGRISINQESVPGLFLYSNEAGTERDAWLHGHVCTTSNYTNWECKGTIVPATNNLFNLGINAARWKDIYSNNSFHGSDRRFKKDITDIKDAEAFVMGLRPRQYRLRDDDDEKVHLGFVAQEVADVMPDHFGGYDDSDPDALCLSYSEFIAPLVATIQAQQQTIKDLSRRIEALERGETSCQ